MTALVVVPPEGMVELPLDLDPARRHAAAGQLTTRLEEVAGGGLREFASLAVVAGDGLVKQGVRMLGQFVVDAPGGPALGTLAIGTQVLAAPDGTDEEFVERAVEALTAQTAQRRPYADTRQIDLPCGPAVASLVYGEFRLPPEETGASAETVVPTFRAEFLVPSPTWDRVVVVDVSTSNEDGWPSVSTAAVGIARSLRFVDEPDDTSGHVLRL
jgi:hypothetical protein